MSKRDTTVLNVKIDKKLKKQAQETAKALGLPMSTLVTVSLKDIVRRRSVTISDEPRLRPEVAQELRELSKAAREGREDLFSPAFHDMDEAIKWLKEEVKEENKS